MKWAKTPLGKLSDGDRETAVETAERLLQIDPSSQDLAWVRDQRTYFLASRESELAGAAEFFPEDHEQAGQPRYRWVDQGDGTKLGYLVDGA